MADEQIPAWAKKLIENTNQLAARIKELNGIDAKSEDPRHKTMSDFLDTLILPEGPMKQRLLDRLPRMKFKDDEDFEDYLEGFKQFYPLKEGNQEENNTEQASKEELDDIMSRVLPSEFSSGNKSEGKASGTSSEIDEIMQSIFPR